MIDHPTTAGFRPVLSPGLGHWVWSRLKVYLAVVLAVTAGFFFVAGWLAAPKSGDLGRVDLLTSWMQCVWAALTVFGAYSGWRSVQRHRDDPHLPPQPKS